MKNDYLDIANAVGMPEITDTTIAMDFLLDAKNAVINYALALSEASSSLVRATLLSQLRGAIALWSETTDLMITKGWFHPHDLSHQTHVDIRSADAAKMIAGLELFPETTNRLGLFPTELNSSRKELS